MNFLFYILCFLAGAAGVFLYYKNRLKIWSNISRRKIIGLTNTDTSTGVTAAQNIPVAFSTLVNTIEDVLRKQHENLPEPASETKADETPDKLKKTIDNLYIVNELGQNVTSSLNLQQTFTHLYTTINSMMDAAVLELCVYNETTGERKTYSNQPVQEMQPNYTNHVADWCFQNNKEVFLSDAENDYGRYVFQPLVLPDGRMAKSILVFPVINRETVSGTLSVISFQKNNFTEYHRQIIRLLLGYIAVAMENALRHEELNITKIRAERSEKFMQQFLANMSHEIRTPIHAITGMTRLLLEKAPLKEQLRYLESIRNASDSLLVIINDILDLSKIEAGKIELEKIDFSIRELLHNVKEIMQFKAEEKGLMLFLQMDESIPPVLIGDPTRITQILLNLVGNAVKFTDKGEVRLVVESVKSQDQFEPDVHKNVQTLTFRISDTGIGLNADQQKKLFQEYAQAGTDTARRYGGTGLGLSISKKLVELQGGTIEVRSREGEGSTFSFTLSFPVSEHKELRQKDKTFSKNMLAQLRGIRVLLADDNEYNRIVAKETLQLKVEEVIVDEAYDGEMAVEMIKTNSYDIVLMDLVMPRLNGLEAAEIVRKKFPAPGCDIPIVAMTASVVKSEMDKCIAVGMNGFIPKPYTSNELIGALYAALRGEPMKGFDINLKVQPSQRLPGKLVDLVHLEDFTEGDKERMQRHLDLFLSKTPQNILMLYEALHENNYENMRIAAHNLKPQLRITGILEGLELAEAIEQNCTQKKSLDLLPDKVARLDAICKNAMQEIHEMKTN